MINNKIIKQILNFQKNEITEYHIYNKLALVEKSGNNRRVLQSIADDELKHYKQWQKITNKEVKPDLLKIYFYFQVSKLFGLTFGLKLMERGEESAQKDYMKISKDIPKAKNILKDEEKHEGLILDLLDEEKLKYIGSIVLGLNDALVELTGALAGFTFALQNTRLIAITGIITGFAAALSMSASEYLSTKSEKTTKHPLKASIYTGIAYIFTVIILIIPYFIFQNIYFCLSFTLLLALLIIAFFNYYVSVAQEECFKSRFEEMVSLSFSIAFISFLVGYLLRNFIG